MSRLPVDRERFDEQGVNEFAGQVGAIVDPGAVVAMISMGHRIGLFDVMAALPPSTSEEIARQAGLNGRYVREWLAVMVTGGVVAYDAGGRTYALPREHAACLTRAHQLGNLPVDAQSVMLMGAMQAKAPGGPGPRVR